MTEEEKNISALNSNTQEGENNNDSNSLNIKICDQEKNIVTFKVKKTTLFSKVINSYLSRTGLDKNSVRFLFDGSRIQDENTPESLGMENEDIVDVVVQQLGGIFNKNGEK